MVGGDSASSLSALGQVLADLAGTGLLESGITSVLNAVAALAGSSDVDADAVATLAAVAALGGAGQVAAVLAGAITAASTVSGSSTSVATLNAVTHAVTAIGGAGAVLPSVLTALAVATANPRGVGELDVSAIAQGSMMALISMATATEELSPEAIAVSVRAAMMDTELSVDLVRKLLQNRTHTDPETGLMTVYDDDDETPLLTAHLYEDVAGTEPYATHSARIDRRDRLA